MKPGTYGEARVINNVVYNCGKDGISVHLPQELDVSVDLVVSNNIIANNKGYGIVPCKNKGSCLTSHNNIWNNAKGKYDGKVTATNDISVDPCFLNPEKGDFHLKSKAGRWDPKAKKWVKDRVSSPCIDAGDPKADHSREPAPNGGRVNMGAYGNTAEASKSQKRQEK